MSANDVRQFGQGLTFGTSDELEALVRSGLGQGDYAKIKAELERQRKEWASNNTYRASAAELVGSAVPGIVGAFTPGGQGATVATLGRVARAIDAPVEQFLARYGPKALQALQRRLPGRLAVGVGDEVLNGMLYSIGQAENYEGIPQKIKDDLLQNTLMSLGVRLGTEGAAKFGKPVKNFVVKAGKPVKNFVVNKYQQIRGR